ncbi:MAG: hypothetical protein QOD58_2518 [Mycobacterium sp.]|jgi:hypothetical protein|nr:hypothetical protein [Mycobacterium sp.]
MRNSDFGNVRGDQPALDEVAHTDLLLDALAARSETDLGSPDDFEDQALALLLGEWRDDLRWPPATALVSQDEAEEALRDGMLDRGRGRRGVATVGSLAATLLMLSGFGAVLADARPGDLLYGLHAMMFNEPRVSDDQIMLSAKADLAKAEQLIAQGQWDQAHTQLAEVSSTLQGVNDGSRRQGLLDEVTQLNTKVDKRDPNAKPRPASPPNPELIVPGAPGGLPGNSLTPPLAPAPEVTLPATASVSAKPIPTTKPPMAATTTPSPLPSPTTKTRPRASTTPPSTLPSTTPPQSTTPTRTTTVAPTPTPTQTPAPTPTSKGKPKLGTSVTPSAPPNSPAAGPTAPARPTPSALPTPSGQLWDGTTAPARPRTSGPTNGAP